MPWLQPLTRCCLCRHATTPCFHRHLLTATVAPRMRVDNAYKVFTYYGHQVRCLPPCLCI